MGLDPPPKNSTIPHPLPQNKKDAHNRPYLEKFGRAVFASGSIKSRYVIVAVKYCAVPNCVQAVCLPATIYLYRSCTWYCFY